MKVLAAAAILALPLLAGCTSQAPVAGLGLFQLAPITRASADPVPLGSCDDLSALLKERALTEARVLLEQSVQNGGSYGYYGPDVVYAMEDSAAGAAATRSSPAAPQSTGKAGDGLTSTGTNNQEADADEADIVKTDGGWMYVLSGGVLRILHADRPGDADLVSRTAFESGYGGQMLLAKRGDGASDDRLVLLLPNSPMPETATTGGAAKAASDARMMMPAYDVGTTRILVLDIKDRSAPKIVQERFIDGELSGAHLMDGVVYAVIHDAAPRIPLVQYASPDEALMADFGYTPEDYWRLTPADREPILREAALRADADNVALLEKIDLAEQLPRMAEVQHGVLVKAPVSPELCQGLIGVPEATGRGITTILALGVGEKEIPANTLQVVGDRPIVYASEATLVLAASSQGDFWYWEQPSLPTTTDLQTFHLDGLGIEPGASGIVAGLVMDTFGLDVHDEKLRVISATGTFNRGWLPETNLVSGVTVFEERAGLLVPTGAVTGIAPGERLWSARFTDDRGYLVTFKAMDPLWIVDLTALQPRILGELHVAGVSTYIHPIGDDRLLTIGYGGGDDGLGLDESKIVVSLFDVANPAKPRQLDALDISPDEGYAYTTALHEHKAFTYWADVGVLSVPLSSGTYTGDSYRSHMGLSLVDVDLQKGLSLHGEVDQDQLTPQYGGEVQRSWFVRDDDAGRTSIYAMSDSGLSAHDLASLGEQAMVAFE